MSFGFSEIEQHVPPGRPGVYVVSTIDGLCLKVGVGGDVLERLKQHRASRQSGLVLRMDGDWSVPRDIESKKSILAKHLYFDRQIAPDLDLKTEAGRRRFLEERCRVEVTLTDSREAACLLEADLEAAGGIRYMGEVLVRPPRSEHHTTRLLRFAAFGILAAALAVLALLWARHA